METKDEMTKEIIQLADGRYLIFYSFPSESLKQEPETGPEERENN
jgi:hypothetical protein